jgi:hypothetical protein
VGRTLLSAAFDFRCWFFVVQCAVKKPSKSQNSAAFDFCFLEFFVAQTWDQKDPTKKPKAADKSVRPTWAPGKKPAAKLKKNLPVAGNTGSRVLGDSLSIFKMITGD